MKCFKNMELECGREDIQTFEKIIKDLLNGHIKVEDVVEPN